MIKITAKNQHASVENVFEDSEYDRAFKYFNMLEEDGTWDSVDWSSAPGLSLLDYTEKTLNSIINQLEPIKITKEEE